MVLFPFFCFSIIFQMVENWNALWASHFIKSLKTVVSNCDMRLLIVMCFVGQCHKSYRLLWVHDYCYQFNDLKTSFLSFLHKLFRFDRLSSWWLSFFFKEEQQKKSAHCHLERTREKKMSLIDWIYLIWLE